jgi:hypothetical protein
MNKESITAKENNAQCEKTKKDPIGTKVWLIYPNPHSRSINNKERTYQRI